MSQEVQTAPRSALSGICTLLVVGLLVGASLSGTDATVRDFGPDTANQRHAVRHITASVARAVRTFVGDHTKPALKPFRAARRPVEGPVGPARIASLPRAPVPLTVRVELLNLPPPAQRG